MFYNSRWYDPQTGRFTQPDTFKGALHQPMTQHPYAYVGNNPINRLDPTGHDFLGYDTGGTEYGTDYYGDQSGSWNNFGEFVSGGSNDGGGGDDWTPGGIVPGDFDSGGNEYTGGGGSYGGGGGGDGGSSGGGESRPPTPEERNQNYNLASQPVSAKHNVQTSTLKQVVSYTRSMPGKPGTGGGGRLPGILIADNSLSSVRDALIKAKNDAWLGMQIFANEAPGAIKNFWEEAENAPVIGPAINFISPNELDAHIGTSLGPQAKFAGYFVQRIAGKKVTSEILESIVGKEASKGAGKAERAIQTYWPPNRGFLGTPKTETLQPGTLIDRYGHPKGTFASPEGTQFEMRALPSENATMPYHVYEVVESVEVNSGRVAPWFGQPGLGTQYEFSSPIQNLLEQGILREAK